MTRKYKNKQKKQTKQNREFIDIEHRPDKKGKRERERKQKTYANYQNLVEKSSTEFPYCTYFHSPGKLNFDNLQKKLKILSTANNKYQNTNF